MRVFTLHKFYFSCISGYVFAVSPLPLLLHKEMENENACITYLTLKPFKPAASLQFNHALCTERLTNGRGLLAQIIPLQPQS